MEIGFPAALNCKFLDEEVSVVICVQPPTGSCDEWDRMVE